MADGLFGRLLGGDDEADEADASEGRVSAEAFAAALAEEHAKHDPEVARAAAIFLRDQSTLLKAQTAEIDEQRALKLRHLQNQSREGKLRRFGLRLRNGLQLFTAVVATVIGLGLLVMIVDAFRAQSVVVEPFDAPPALAARGLTGKVVAGGVLDALTRLQAATRSSATQRRLANAWTGDIKIEVPETGISIGELGRMLKDRFGHDTLIEGDLVQTETGGLALTIRGDGVLPKTFEGGGGDLDRLTTQAAEYVYGQSQPSLYATYLMRVGRNAEAVAFAKAAYATDDEADKPYLLTTWANGMQNTGAGPRESAPLYAEAVRLKPDFWAGYSNLMNVELLLGDEEGAWRTGEAMYQKAGGRPGRARESDYQNADLVNWNLLPWRKAVIADAKAHAGGGSDVAADAPAIADIDARLHDSADAELQLQTTQADASDPTIAAMTHFVHGRLAAEAGDVARAAAEMEAFGAAFADPVVSSNYGGYNCWIALAEEAAGHPDKADAALKAGGHYVDCFRFRGDILDHRGDWAGAQKAYAQAVAIAPDLPAGLYSWGVALARHGDLAGAEAKLAAAHTRGPGWADPLKAWGDVLGRQGRWKDALAKYDQALQLAPKWADLHRARDAAVQHAS
ncbi:MAG: tetratricopeptide repeat protein [Caulobacteraceae bacterium]|nr:tetratricopeptide repeat protein [Caulobacteraceae bacterium]